MQEPCLSKQGIQVNSFLAGSKAKLSELVVCLALQENPQEVYFDHIAHAANMRGRPGWEGNVYTNPAGRDLAELRVLSNRRRMGETLTKHEHRRCELWGHGDVAFMLRGLHLQCCL